MASLMPFGLNGATVKCSAAATSVSQPITAGGNTSVLVTNAGTVLGYVRSGKGSATAVVTDTPVLPGSAQTFSIPIDHDTVAAISSSATSIDVYFTVGSGH